MNYRYVSVLILATALVGCVDQRMDDLRQFVENAHKDRKPRVDPLPRIRPHETFVYTASNLTDPFSVGNLRQQKPAPGKGLAPDPTRRKEPLEQFPLDALSMVGTLSKGDISWAVIRAPDGTVHRAAAGNYLGQNYGKIVKVSDEKLEITELHQEGNGNWVERQTNLAIAK